MFTVEGKMTQLIASNIQYWLDLGTAIVGTVGGLILGVLYFTKKYQETKDKKEQNSLNVNSKDNYKHTTIHELLTSLRFQLNADRIQLAQFHNGGKFLEGSPIKRFSVTHESCRPGISMESVNLHNILVSLFWCLIGLLKENDPKIRLTRSLQEDIPLKTYNESKNIEAFCVLPIKKEEMFLGFIKAEWNNLHDIPDDYENSERLMDKYRSFIELELLRGT
jgi:hypothetical protein